MEGTKHDIPDGVAVAKQLASQGFTVIPLGSPMEQPPEWFVGKRCGGDQDKAIQDWPKTPRIKWKDYQTRTPDKQIFEGWINGWTHSNWAVVTGNPVVVVDADSDQAVAFMESGKVTKTPVRVKTSQGKHYYYRTNPDIEIRNSVQKNKIDLRGHGGYVVAAGSTHATGVVYEWEFEPGFELTDIPEDLPQLNQNDLHSIGAFNGVELQDKPVGNLGFSADMYRVAHDGSNLSEGQGRNNAAASMAGQLIRQGNSIHEIKTLLDSWNGNNNPPLSDQELNTTIASVSTTHLRNNPGAFVPVEPLLAPEEIRKVFGFSPVTEAGSKPVQWLIKGFLETDSLALLFGEPGGGKSFVALGISCCIASATQWHGHEVKKPGPVFYIAGEGHNGLRRRVDAWCLENHVPIQKVPMEMSHSSASLMDRMNVAEVRNSIETRLKILEAEKPALIVVDTLARNFGAGDENHTKDMNQFIENIDLILRRKYQCCVLVVHHSSVGNKERARGNGALKGAVDAEYALMKTDDGITLKPTKMKDADEPDPMLVDLVQIPLGYTDDDGEMQTSCVLRKVTNTAADNLVSQAQNQESSLGHKQRLALHELKRLYADCQAVREQQGQDPATVCVETVAWRNACVGKDKVTNSRQNWPRLRDQLIEKGLVKIVGPHAFLAE